MDAIAMKDSELKAILAAEKSDAMSAMRASKLSEDRAKAMDYYNGIMTDMTSEPGRSSAVSTDVLDTIEGMMPALMEIFCGGDEVVKFDPVGPEDVKAAEQETDFINWVFMQQNPGFMILYTFIKDALLSKTGIVKVDWEEREDEERQTYYGITDDQLMMLASDPEIEIEEYSLHNPGADKKADNARAY